MAEFRRDPITGRWIIIAAERAARPRQFGGADASAPGEPCPFCAGNEAMTPPEVWASRTDNSPADRPGWRVRVVPNKYPALVSNGPWEGGQDGFYQSLPGLGVHEVIVECPDHVTRMSDLADERFEDIVRAYRERLSALSRDQRWRYLLIYKNQGDRAGATFEHLHSQLVALPSMPREADDEMAGATAHFAASGRCIYCDIIERELADGRRVIFAHDRFVALCPFAPRFAYETWILPRTHEAVFGELSEQGVQEFARALCELIRRLNRALDNPPFNYFIHTLSRRDGATASYHWHLELLPQLFRAAGFELGSGSNINGVAPEVAAKLLRAVTL